MLYTYEQTQPYYMSTEYCLSIYNKNYNQRMSYLSTSHYKYCLIFKAFIDVILKVCSLPFENLYFSALFIVNHSTL